MSDSKRLVSALTRIMELFPGRPTEDAPDGAIAFWTPKAAAAYNYARKVLDDAKVTPIEKQKKDTLMELFVVRRFLPGDGDISYWSFKNKKFDVVLLHQLPFPEGYEEYTTQDEREARSVARVMSEAHLRIIRVFDSTYVKGSSKS